MEFIVENYVWFIIGGITILMAVVGYIADITDFGRKALKDRATKEAANEKDVLQTPVVDNIVTDINEVEQEPIETVEDNMPIDNQIDFDDEAQLAETTDFSENGLEQADISTLPSFESETVENTNIDQSLFEPLPSIDQVFSEPIQAETVENNLESGNDVSAIVSDDNLEAPNTQTTEDDVWNF